MIQGELYKKIDEAVNAGLLSKIAGIYLKDDLLVKAKACFPIIYGLSYSTSTEQEIAKWFEQWFGEK